MARQMALQVVQIRQMRGNIAMPADNAGSVACMVANVAVWRNGIEMGRDGMCEWNRMQDELAGMTLTSSVLITDKDKEDSAVSVMVAAASAASSGRRERAPNVIIMVAGHLDVARAVRLRSEAPFAVGRPNRFGFTCHCTAITVHIDIAVVVVRRQQGKQAKTKLALE